MTRQLSVLESAEAMPNMSIPQRQEAEILASDDLLPRPMIWGKTLRSQSFPSHLISPSYMGNHPLSSLPANAGIGHQSKTVNRSQVGLAEASACSLESPLDCLLSATNSNTNTSVEDDGISMILSDCRTLWNFGGGSASSAESENNGSEGRDKKAYNGPMNEHDETVSQSPADQYLQSLQGRLLDTKPTTTKRSNSQIEQKACFGYGHYDMLQSDSHSKDGSFRLISENFPKHKKPRSEKRPRSSNINFQQPSSSGCSSIEEPDAEAIAQMKEMIYRAAAFRPVNLGAEVVEKPKRKNVKISTDPQTVAARQRRERISERIRVLQRLVPGGNKMDTASMLDEAASYLKFLRSQVKALENLGQKLDSLNCPPSSIAFSFNPSFPIQTPFSLQGSNDVSHPQR